MRIKKAKITDVANAFALNNDMTHFVKILNRLELAEALVNLNSSYGELAGDIVATESTHEHFRRAILNVLKAN